MVVIEVGRTGSNGRQASAPPVKPGLQSGIEKSYLFLRADPLQRVASLKIYAWLLKVTRRDFQAVEAEGRCYSFS
jgi:hypothetical protein